MGDIIMSALQIIFGILQIIVCVGLIAVIILQQGKSAGLSGAIAGGAETFFGKNKARTMEAKLEKGTTGLAIAFVVLTVVLNILAKLAG